MNHENCVLAKQFMEECDGILEHWRVIEFYMETEYSQYTPIRSKFIKQIKAVIKFHKCCLKTMGTTCEDYHKIDRDIRRLKKFLKKHCREDKNL